MGRLVFAASFWLVFLAPAVPVAAACWLLGRRRVQWFGWEYSLLVVPYLVWMLFAMIGDEGKSLSNAVVEPFWLGCGAGLACVLRVLAGARVNQKIMALSLYAAVCALAVGLWAFVPTLPE